jgi:hypothetical protein
LGETLDQCKARYGEPKNGANDQKEFVKNGIAINAHFAKDGRCDYIFFTAYELLTRRKFTPDERGDLQKANNLGKILSRTEKSEPGTILWESADGEVAALMTGNESRILFCTKDGWAVLEASLKQGKGVQPKPTDGF